MFRVCLVPPPPSRCEIVISHPNRISSSGKPLNVDWWNALETNVLDQITRGIHELELDSVSHKIRGAM